MDLSVLSAISLNNAESAKYIIQGFNGCFWETIKGMEFYAESDREAINDAEEMFGSAIKANGKVHFILWRCASRNNEMGEVKRYNF